MIAVYCPNGNHRKYEELESVLPHTGNSAIVEGDINAHSDLWEDGYSANTSERNVKQFIYIERKCIQATPKNLARRPCMTDNRKATIDPTLRTPNQHNYYDTNLLRK